MNPKLIKIFDVWFEKFSKDEIMSRQLLANFIYYVTGDSY